MGKKEVCKRRELCFTDDPYQRQILEYIDNRNRLRYPTLMSYIGAAVLALEESGRSGREMRLVPERRTEAVAEQMAPYQRRTGESGLSEETVRFLRSLLGD